jgi:hypothetical protein
MPDEPHLSRLRLSLTTLRHHDPDVFVHVVIVAERGFDARHGPLFGLADLVETVPPLHLRSRYFQDNCVYLGRVRTARVLYIDSDTLFFSSVRALADLFTEVDVAACPNRWVFRHRYDLAFAPEIEMPLNGGVMLMTREFCRYWAGLLPECHESVMTDPARTELAAWLRSVTPNAYHRHEFVLSEAAWSGAWHVGLLDTTDCRVLAVQPGGEDPRLWLQSTILHTYGSQWVACVNRLRDEPTTPGWLRALLPPWR